MLAKVLSMGVLGIEAYPIEIEVDVTNGLPVVNLIGLADTAIKESRARVKTAIKNSGFEWPGERITISLAPSDVRKEGTGYDLPIALGILSATGQINSGILEGFCILGELSLDGSLRPGRGVLAVCASLEKFKIKNIILPYQNAKEASLVKGVSVWPQETLKQTVEFLNNPEGFTPSKINLEDLFKNKSHYSLDFSEIKGQYAAKRAIEVAVSGGHNILMIGPPGSGKTMLAKRITTIEPELSLEEALEVTKIHSIAGMLPTKDGIIATRPFRLPHHTISDSALVGGGNPPQPGEISLAHQGVLFLDELPEFRRDCLESLRQPLEDGFIHIGRVKRSFVFPASFMLVCAMNPCPCGNFSDPSKTCKCNPGKIANYMAKISGPLLDRIDIHIELPAIKYRELSDPKESESSTVIKIRVEKARHTQRERLKAEGIFYNARMDSKLTKKYCVLEEQAKELLRTAMEELRLSARAYDKILKVSRTVSDLAGSETILPEHIAEAIQYRNLDRQLF
jgi:magnesium chelatase family protein